MRPVRPRSHFTFSNATVSAPRCRRFGGSSQPEASSPPAAQTPQERLRALQAEQPNERWQLDITHWALADGTDVEILNILDDDSRLCPGSQTLRCSRLATSITASPKLLPPMAIRPASAATMGPSSPAATADKAQSP